MAGRRLDRQRGTSACPPVGLCGRAVHDERSTERRLDVAAFEAWQRSQTTPQFAPHLMQSSPLRSFVGVVQKGG